MTTAVDVNLAPQARAIPLLPVGGDGGPIPRTLHLIWVGGEVPEFARASWDLWRDLLGDGWEIREWTDESLAGTPMARTLTLGHAGWAWRGVADLLRLQVVGYFGGVYVDTDTVLLGSLDEYVGERRAWIGSGSATKGAPVLNNGTFGFPARHSFLAQVLARGIRMLALGRRDEHWVAGPRAFRAVHDRGYRESVEVDYSFQMNSLAECRAMVRSGRYDLDHLRETFPGVPVLHTTLH